MLFRIRKEILVAVLILSSFLSFAFNWKGRDLAKFKIKVETTGDVLSLTSKIDNTAWRVTTFDLKVGEEQAINQFGMTSVGEERLGVDPKLTSFLFKVKRTKEGLEFKGLRGTAWKKISFSCKDNSCAQLIDEYGMAEDK